MSSLSFSCKQILRNVWPKYSKSKYLTRDAPQLLQGFQIDRLQSFVHEQASDVSTTDGLGPFPLPVEESSFKSILLTII